MTYNMLLERLTKLTKWGILFGVCTPTLFFSTVIPSSSSAFSRSRCTSCVRCIFSSHVSFRLSMSFSLVSN